MSPTCEANTGRAILPDLRGTDYDLRAGFSITRRAPCRRGSSEVKSLIRPRQDREGGIVRTLITGGAGFIGSHLCERFLALGHEVICVDNIITGTLGNVEHLRRHDH